MSEFIRKISSFNFDNSTRVDQLLSVFDLKKCPIYLENEVIFFQQWSAEILQYKLILSIEESKTIWINLVQTLEIIYSFHCSCVYHELLFKILDVFVQKSDCETSNLKPFKNLASQILLTELNNIESILWKTFRDSKYERKHCLCNSIKCLQRILQLINEEDPKKINIEVFDKSLDLILKLYHPQIQSIRCLAYEFLKFLKFLINYNHYPQILNCFNNWIYSNILLESYVRYFQTARDFCGNILRLHIDSLSSELIAEFRYDCPLIRCYVLLVLKFISIQNIENSYTFLLKHLNILKSKIKNENDSIGFPIEWMIEVFTSEDSEVFDMLYQMLLLYGTNLEETDFLIHRLFKQFIVGSIYQDSSVLLEMLCTDHSTATTFLQFLIAYLKIPPFRTTGQVPEWLNPVVFMLIELRSKIQKLYDKNLFPYNPRPLLRLLNYL